MLAEGAWNKPEDAMSDQPLRQAVIEAGINAVFTGSGPHRDYVAAARTALEHARQEGRGNRWWTIGADDLLVALLAQLLDDAPEKD